MEPELFENLTEVELLELLKAKKLPKGDNTVKVLKDLFKNVSEEKISELLKQYGEDEEMDGNALNQMLDKMKLNRKQRREKERNLKKGEMKVKKIKLKKPPKELLERLKI